MLCEARDEHLVRAALIESFSQMRSVRNGREGVLTGAHPEPAVAVQADRGPPCGATPLRDARTLPAGADAERKARAGRSCYGQADSLEQQLSSQV